MAEQVRDDLLYLVLALAWFAEDVVVAATFIVHGLDRLGGAAQGSVEVTMAPPGVLLGPSDAGHRYEQLLSSCFLPLWEHTPDCSAFAFPAIVAHAFLSQSRKRRRRK